MAQGKKIAKKIGCGCSGCLLPMLLVFLIMVGSVLMITNDDDKKDDEKPIDFSTTAVLQYQSYVTEKCAELGIEDYANVVLAIMYNTSKGEGMDVMGAYCLLSNKNHKTITTPQQSIDIGIQEFKNLLDLYRVKKIDDENLKMVCQHYHIISTLSVIKELPNGEKTIKKRFGDLWKKTVDKYTSDKASEFGNKKINLYKDNKVLYLYNPTEYSSNFADDVMLTIQNLSSAINGGNPNNLGWIFPLKKGTYSLTSLAGMRFHPIEKRYKMHWGIDYGTGTSCPPIYAVADGVVDMCGFNGSWGNYVRIKHSNTFATGYAHQSKIVVQNGQSVKKGQIIGYVGSTGGSTGNHLHLEVWKNEGQGFTRINPNDFFKDID